MKSFTGPPGRAACLTSVQPHSIKSSLCRDGPLGETLAQECLEVFRCVVITLPVPQSASPQTRDPNPALSEGETWTNPDHTRNPVIPEEGVLPTKCSMSIFSCPPRGCSPVYLSLKANYIAAVLCQSKLSSGSSRSRAADECGYSKPDDHHLLFVALLLPCGQEMQLEHKENAKKTPMSCSPYSKEEDEPRGGAETTGSIWRTGQPMKRIENCGSRDEGGTS
ncbi:hypothetical protein NQZ68_001069 [Dissostichus eleginoides]|nr:hypothetical protein NQZ68_001069 [Dissostichus eleginoides]